ncbi:MAG TPA: tetratricopeptide repeat protein, partial [Rubricoccaceae bacterium]
MRQLSPSLLLVLLAALSACAVPAAGGLGGARTLADAGNYSAALALADTAVARTPTDAEAYILRADIRRRQIAADTASVDSIAVVMALADAQRAVALAPTNVNATNVMTNLWITSMNRGGQAFQQSPPDYRGARILFRTAAQVRPDSAQSQVNYGLALYASGNEDAAVEPYRTAIRLDPTDAATYRRLGRSLLAADQGTEAITVLEDAATRFPEDAAIRADLFAAYERTPGRAADALARYETELARATPATEPAMRLQYGVALLQARRVDDAIR